MNQALRQTEIKSKEFQLQEQIVTKGHFQNGVHEPAGVATIYQLAEGKHILCLTNFSTSNGPDV